MRGFQKGNKLLGFKSQKAGMAGAFCPFSLVFSGNVRCKANGSGR